MGQWNEPWKESPNPKSQERKKNLPSRPLLALLAQLYETGKGQLAYKTLLTFGEGMARPCLGFLEIPDVIFIRQGSEALMSATKCGFW